MLKTRVRVESKSLENNDLLVRVSNRFPLARALESRIDTLACRVLANVSHSTRELYLWSSLAYIHFNTRAQPVTSRTYLELRNYCVDYGGRRHEWIIDCVSTD